MTWERVDDERGAHVPEYVETRVCAYEPCGTILSAYNSGDYCSVHEGLDESMMRIPVGSNLEDEAALLRTLQSKTSVSSRARSARASREIPLCRRCRERPRFVGKGDAAKCKSCYDRTWRRRHAL